MINAGPVRDYRVYGEDGSVDDDVIALPPDKVYRGTSLTRKCTPLGPYRRTMPRVPGGS